MEFVRVGMYGAIILLFLSLVVSHEVSNRPNHEELHALNKFRSTFGDFGSKRRVPTYPNP